MSLISKYYVKILEEFFDVNSGDNSQHGRETNSEKSSFHFQDMMETKIKHVEDNSQFKTIFEKVLNEIANIEYALNYFIALSERNKKKKISRIESNETNVSHLRNSS